MAGRKSRYAGATVMKKALIAAGILSGLVLAAVAGQAAWLHWRLDRAGLVGTLVDLGGRGLHLACAGAGTPVYVLEAGAMGSADMWQWVQGALQRDARVCAYDRAGLGASDANPSGFAPSNVRRDLKAALTAAREPGPYVLVGHSLGGVFVRSFAAAYPDDVRALVLVDPAHEDQLDRFDAETVRQFETLKVGVRRLAIAARFGLLRFWNPFSGLADGLEGRSLERIGLYAQDAGHLTAASAEFDAWNAIMEDRRRNPVPAALPVLVITAGAARGRSGETGQVVLLLHRELAQASRKGRHEVIADANHFSILVDRPTAERLAGAIRRFVEETAR
jgi:pimeloyl-ACP methyl ester carboxylesterase